MNVVVLKTNVSTKKKVNRLKCMIDTIPQLNRWSVDLEDVDHVLRVETLNPITELDLMTLVQAGGFSCEIMSDDILR